MYEENLNLHERLAQLQLRLEGLRETRRDLDNMCARASAASVLSSLSPMALTSQFCVLGGCVCVCIVCVCVCCECVGGGGGGI